METFLLVLQFITGLVFSAVMGYTVVTVWDIDRRTKRMEETQLSLVWREFLEEMLGTQAAEPGDTKEEAHKKAEGILKKHENPTAKKTTTKKGKK